MRSFAWAIALSMVAHTAWANPAETLGVGARSIGTGGSGVAWVNDPTAAYTNPAGLSHIRRPEGQLGFLFGAESFEAIPSVWWDTNQDGAIDEQDDPLQVSSNVDDTLGFTASMGRNIGKRFGVGLTLYVPAKRLIRFMTFEPSLPTYFMQYNRPQRLVLALGVGAKVAPGIHLGASVDVVPRAHSHLVATVSGGLHGVDEEDQVLDPVVVDVHQVAINLKPGASPILGLQIDFGQWVKALKGLQLGLVWRGSAGFPLTLDVNVQGNVSISDIGELEPYVAAAILQGQMQMTDHYVPMSVSGGLSYSSRTGHGFYIDAIWRDWRPMQAAVAQVKNGDLTLPLVDLEDGLQDNNPLEVTLQPTVSIRGGAEFTLPKKTLPNGFQYVQLQLRVGAGFDPTPLKSQGWDSALLDTERVMVSAGVSLETADPLKLLNGPLQFDLFGQFHGYMARSLARQSAEPKAGYPVDSSEILIGGTGWLVGGQWRFAY